MNNYFFSFKKVYSENPHWRYQTRCSKSLSTDDRSSCVDWSGSLSTLDINLSTAWSVGCKKAIKQLKSYGYCDMEFDLSAHRTITMLRPFGDELADDMVDEEGDTVEVK